MKRLFHYTTASRLQKILETKAIRQATLSIEDGEKPAVWFSFRQDWEPTATPALVENGIKRRLTFAELAGIETPARIEIDPKAAPMDWPAWRKLSGVKPRIARRLEAVARAQKSYVLDWRMSFDPITVEHWLAIELFVRGQWRDIEEVFATEKAAQ